jgi:hypothetical protein
MLNVKQKAKHQRNEDRSKSTLKEMDLLTFLDNHIPDVSYQALRVIPNLHSLTARDIQNNLHRYNQGLYFKTVLKLTVGEFMQLERFIRQSETITLTTGVHSVANSIEKIINKINSSSRQNRLTTVNNKAIKAGVASFNTLDLEKEEQFTISLAVGLTSQEETLFVQSQKVNSSPINAPSISIPSDDAQIQQDKCRWCGNTPAIIKCMRCDFAKYCTGKCQAEHKAHAEECNNDHPTLTLNSHRFHVSGFSNPLRDSNKNKITFDNSKAKKTTGCNSQKPPSIKQNRKQT